MKTYNIFCLDVEEDMVMTLVLMVIRMMSRSSYRSLYLRVRACWSGLPAKGTGSVKSGIHK